MLTPLLRKALPLQRLRRSPAYDFYQRNLLPLRYKYRTPAYISPTLLFVEIEPTNRCNLKCPLCPSQNAPSLPRKKGLMDFGLFQHVVDEIAALGTVTALGLTYGGEALLHPRFAEMLEYAAAKDQFKIFLYTNGTLFDDRISDAFCRLKGYRVVFSLDGHEAVHEAYRRGSKYNLVVKNILAFADRRGGERLPQIFANMTLHQQTPEEVREFVDFWVQRVDRVEISPGVGEDMNYIDPVFYEQSPREEKAYCPYPFHYLGVFWNGDVTTCIIDCQGRNVIGNLASQTLPELWNGKSYRMFRYLTIKNAPHPGPLCDGCNYWRYWFRPRTIREDGMTVTYELDGKFYERPDGLPSLHPPLNSRAAPSASLRASGGSSPC